MVSLSLNQLLPTNTLITTHHQMSTMLETCSLGALGHQENKLLLLPLLNNNSAILVNVERKMPRVWLAELLPVTLEKGTLILVSIPSCSLQPLQINCCSDGLTYLFHSDTCCLNTHKHSNYSKLPNKRADYLLLFFTY